MTNDLRSEQYDFLEIAAEAIFAQLPDRHKSKLNQLGGVEELIVRTDEMVCNDEFPPNILALREKMRAYVIATEMANLEVLCAPAADAGFIGQAWAWFDLWRSRRRMRHYVTQMADFHAMWIVYYYGRARVAARRMANEDITVH